MSLRVWLPLNGTLDNKGLDDVVVTNNGATIDNNGKIGKCYSFSSKAIYGEVPNVNNMTEMSGCCWVYLTSLNSAQYFFHLGGINSYPSKISLDYEGSIRSQVNGTEYISGISLTANTWYHITVTVGNGKVKWYLNGKEKASANVSGSFNASNHLAIGARINSSSGNTFAYPIVNAGRLNDVRIYDHCLSPLEVKQISQGLILHYPLNRNGWGQENLALNTHNLNLYSNKNNLYMYFRGAATRRLRADGFYEAYCTGDWQGLSFWANQLNLKSGDKITYSFYIYTNGTSCGYSFYPMIYNSSGSRDTSTTFPISIDGDNYINGNSRTFGNTTTTFPEKHYVVFEWNDSVKTIIDNGGSIELSIQVSGGNWTNRWACIYAPKIEKGDKVTPWCPNTSDELAITLGLNDNVEYDTSGYCNNGTRTGTFTWISDTPKYNVSTIFTEGCSISTINNLSNPCSEFSVGGWVNLMEGYVKNNGCHLITFNGTYCRICISKDGLAVRVLLTNGSTNYMGGSTLKDSALTANEWNYFVITFKSGIIKIYINGLLDADLTATITQINFPSSNISIGQHGSEKPNAKVSDFRFYVTALSADDVKSLYNNSAYIDNQGNIYGAVYEEV